MTEERKSPRDEDDSDAERGDHLSSPEAGYPTEETQPLGGMPEGAHEHPEDIDDTTPDKQSSP